MTTQEVANRLVELCREGKFEQVFQELYSPEIVSIEPEGAPWGTVQGFEAIANKGKEWNEMVTEFHSSEISEPIVAENFFSITMKSKVTMKGMDQPINMDEVCLYEVNNGKVVKEQFFYTPIPELV
ncbi:nuclear transport factor 2 family protein [Ekhidna sp.]|uniref:nuclear transport factor 2 family protein n=1 Tax=Ekhidna sp. TaxID=2608089 RepID=UPI003299A202